MDIEIRRYTTEGHGSFMYIEGYFVESWLSRGVILEPAKLPVSLPANIVSAVRSTIQSRVINDLPGMSSLIQLGTYESTAQTTEGCDENEFEVGLIAQQLLKSLDMSQRLRFNYDTKKFYYDI